MITTLVFACAGLVAHATLRVVTIDGPVDLGHPSVAGHVRSETLRGFVHDGLDLTAANRAPGCGHGTLVARRLLRGLPAGEVELIPVPVGQVSGWRDLPRLRDRVDQLFARVEHVLANASVRVVNGSVPFDLDDDAWNGYRHLLPGLRRLHAAHVARFIDLMARYPETLFVHAAGNDGRALRDAGAPSIATAALPNLIVVGAHDGATRGPAAYSNHSDRFVDVFAHGTAFGESGTSVSAPAVVNALLSDWSAHPDLSATEIKNRLLSVTTVSHPSFGGRGRGARVLPGTSPAEAVVPTFALAYDPGDGATALARALARPRGADLNPAPPLPREGQRRDPDHRNMFHLLRATLSKQPRPDATTERARLRDWLDEPATAKRVIAFARDGSEILTGVMVQNGAVAALDPRSRELARAIEAIACERRLIQVP